MSKNPLLIQNIGDKRKNKTTTTFKRTWQFCCSINELNDQGGSWEHGIVQRMKSRGDGVESDAENNFTSIYAKTKYISNKLSTDSEWIYLTFYCSYDYIQISEGMVLNIVYSF